MAPATEEDVCALEPRALAGERAAIAKLFALYVRADGGVAECIDMTLGDAIRRHPQTVLEEWRRSGLDESQWVREHLLGNMIQWVDDFPAQREELRLRIAALSDVAVPDLLPLRDRCLESLRRHLANLPG